MRIMTAEIVVNGKRKIVNADDPRVNANAVSEKPQAQEIKPRRGRPKKAVSHGA